eukprot:jgi/Bigna1/141659/aug1.64_g16367
MSATGTVLAASMVSAVAAWKLVRGQAKTAKEDELVYFDLAGRGEYIRLAGVIGNVSFKDRRLTRDEFLRKKKSGEFNFSQVPVFLTDGKKVAQSTSILRLVGKRGGLYPKDPVKAAEVDGLLDLIEEAWSCLDNTKYPTRFGFPDWDAKTRLDPSFCWVWEEQAIEGINTSVITSQFSRIQALVDKIDALPAVKKYYGGK